MKYVKKAELHCHSKSNFLPYAPGLMYDSVQTVEEILAKAIEKGISILAITDHNSMAGSRKAQKLVKENNLNLLIVPGCEISSSHGHILAYGIQEEIPRKMSPEKTIEAIHSQGGIAVAAHPFMPTSLGKRIFKLKLDAIETHNSMIPKVANKLAQKMTENIKNIPKTCGSDAHQTGMIGYGCMLFSENINSVSEVMKAISRNDFEINFKQTPIVPVLFEHIGRNLFPGDKKSLSELLNH